MSCWAHCEDDLRLVHSENELLLISHAKCQGDGDSNCDEYRNGGYQGEVQKSCATFHVLSLSVASRAVLKFCRAACFGYDIKQPFHGHVVAAIVDDLRYPTRADQPQLA